MLAGKSHGLHQLVDETQINEIFPVIYYFYILFLIDYFLSFVHRSDLIVL